MQNDIKIFLQALFGQKPDHLHILLWERLEAKKLSHWFTDWERAADFAETHNVNLYAGVGLSPENYGPYQRCKQDQIAGMVGLYADIDVAGPGHKTKALPSTDEEALSILPPDFEASIIIQSGHGLQAWWLFKEPLIFDNAEDHEHGKQITHAWDRYLKNRAAKHGWTVDSVFDLSRILRVPGTINRKEGLEDAEAKILEVTAARYNPSDFDGLLGEPEPKPRPVTLVLPPAVGEFVFNPNAVIDPILYTNLYEADMGFRMTWSGARPDLKDQSQSSYDMALANVLWDARVTDQQAADALAHHRRLRNAPPKQDPHDYIVRTLRRARDREASGMPIEELQGLANGIVSGVITGKEGGVATLDTIEQAARIVAPLPRETVDTRPSLSGDPDKDLRVLNDNIRLICGKIPNPITRLVRVGAGRETSWRLTATLTNQVVTFLKESEWATYDGFAGAIRTQLSNTTCVIPNKRTDWERKIVPYFAALWEEAEPGTEEDIRETTKRVIDGYLSDRSVHPKAVVFSDPRRNGFAFVFEETNEIAIHAPAVVEWAWKNMGTRIPENAITSGLSAIGARRKTISRSGRTTQSRWLLPRAEWKHEDYVLTEEQIRLGGES